MELSHTTSNNDNILRTINIQKILFDKEQFIPLLSIADPSVNMIQSYLFKGELYVLFSNGQAISAAVIISVGDKEFELKNLSSLYNRQKKGYGSILLTKILELYNNADKIWVGTGSPGINKEEFYQISFYKRFGFEYVYTIKDFFKNNYLEPIYEYNGLQCIDMVYLSYTPSHHNKKSDKP